MPAFVFASMLAGGPAHAGGGAECQVNDPQTGTCLIRVKVEVPEHASDHRPKRGKAGACYWDGSSQGVAKPAREKVPCSSENGNWSNTENCYFSQVSPQPPAGDPAWDGHEPGDGAVYTCTQPQTGIDLYMWAAEQPAGAGLTAPDVALMAIDSMNLRAIDIGITPKPGANSVGVVGMPVWMWVANPDPSTYGPASGSASAGGITVTATARVQQITWAMGDGAVVVCRTPGTPYKASYGGSESPDCGHVYEQSSVRTGSGQYTVTATSNWLAEWEGAGQSGTIPLSLNNSAELTIGEGQVLVR